MDESHTGDKKAPAAPPQERNGLSVGPRKTARPRRKRAAKAPSATPASGGLDPSLYLNKELSWLEFNQRVLDEALDQRHPLLERVKFLAIVSTNLDEFFMIRVAAIKEQLHAGVVEYSPDGRIPTEQLKVIHERASRMMDDMRACFWNDLHPKLKAAGIHLLTLNELTPDEGKALADRFAREIFPVLTRLAFDPGHPFPYISNLSLSLAVVIKTPKGEERFARVKVPDVLPRLVAIPTSSSDSPTSRFIWLEDVIADNLHLLFPGMEVTESYVFRVTRNADVEIQEDEAED